MCRVSGLRGNGHCAGGFVGAGRKKRGGLVGAEEKVGLEFMGGGGNLGFKLDANEICGFQNGTGAIRANLGVRG